MALSAAEKSARYRAAHPDRVRKTKAKSRLKHRDENRAKDARRNQVGHLMRKYNLTPDARDALLASQGGRCANPGCSNVPGVNVSFHVDHDHRCCPGVKTCGKCIRGLLCSDCNRAAGFLRDDPARCVGLASYLTSHLS